AAVPIVLLLVTLGVFEWRAPWGVLTGLGAALAASVGASCMAASAAVGAAIDAAPYGVFPIGWIIVNAVFLYNLTVASGQFEIVKMSVARLSADRRIQAPPVALLFPPLPEGEARRDHRGAAQRARVLAAVLRGVVADRQPRAGRVRGDRHADPHPRHDHR